MFLVFGVGFVCFLNTKNVAAMKMADALDVFRLRATRELHWLFKQG